MDADITFGDVEEERPRVMRRPDEDRHFAVSACGEPRESDLPIFVDLDAMVDMENHAQTNTNVELGGVLLGGQYVDGGGKPFVIVTDCLRADHFEATKGSFKFTHETWSDIQRRLSEYPDDLRMVGWYHTHPDWGVFLSGMDMFICDNFFNKPLDLALVIDPCRDDRGWFQWTTQGRRGTFRTGGFYLTSSRFREEELQFVAQALEGGSEMPLATRSGSQTSGGYGAPVVNVVQDRSSSHWIQIAVLGSLTLQTVLVAVLAFSFMGRGASLDEARLKDEETKLKATQATLDQMARRMANTDEDFVKKSTEIEMERDALRTALATASRVQKDHEGEVKALSDKLEDWEQYKKKSDKEAKDASDKIDQLRQLVKDQKAALAEKDGESAGFDWKSPWLWTVIATSVAVILAGVLVFRASRPTDDYSDNPLSPPHEPAPPDSDDFKEPPDAANTN